MSQGKPAVPRAVRPLADRFWDKVVFGMECWGWSGGKTRFGYGVLGRGRRGEGYVNAHRVSYELHYGPIPRGAQVLHTCDNPQCANPAHLVLGTQLDNVGHQLARGRFRRLSPEARERARQTTLSRWRTHRANSRM